MGHYIAPTGKIYVDTDFVNRVQKLASCTPNQRGFELKTPNGVVSFDHTRGASYEGQSGRSYEMFDGVGNRLAMGLVQEMTWHGHSEPPSSVVVAEDVTSAAVPDNRVKSLLEKIRDTSTAMLNQLERHGGFGAASQKGHTDTLKGQLGEIDTCKRVLERAFSSVKTASEHPFGNDDWKADYGENLSRSDNTVDGGVVGAGDPELGDDGDDEWKDAGNFGIDPGCQ